MAQDRFRTWREAAIFFMKNQTSGQSKAAAPAQSRTQ